MTTLAQHFFAHAVNNAWANHRLLRACAALSRAEFMAPRSGFFPSIQKTLNHNLTVDWYYVAAIERALDGVLPDREHGRSYFEPEFPFDGCAELTLAQRAVDQRLLARCRDLSPSRIALEVGVPRREGIANERLDRLLAHLFQHQVHHRGQVHAMLSSTNVAPPQLDELFCGGDAPLRAAELRELGIDEAEIFPA